MKRTRGTAAQRTRGALIQAARTVFCSKRYHDAGTTEIAALAGVTRGALQYHFPRKKDLFLAVIDEVERDWMTTMRGHGPDDSDTWQGLLARLDAFLDTAVTPEIQRIVLIDGPAVLDSVEWRSLCNRHSIGGIERAIVDGMETGQIRKQASGPLAQLILTLFYEAAVIAAQTETGGQGRDDLRIGLRTLLDNLR